MFQSPAPNTDECIQTNKIIVFYYAYLLGMATHYNTSSRIFFGHYEPCVCNIFSRKIVFPVFQFLNHHTAGKGLPASTSFSRFVGEGGISAHSIKMV